MELAKLNKLVNNSKVSLLWTPGDSGETSLRSKLIKFQICTYCHRKNYVEEATLIGTLLPEYGNPSSYSEPSSDFSFPVLVEINFDY